MLLNIYTAPLLCMVLHRKVKERFPAQRNGCNGCSRCQGHAGRGQAGSLCSLCPPPHSSPSGKSPNKAGQPCHAALLPLPRCLHKAYTSDKARLSKPSAQVICISTQFSAAQFPAKSSCGSSHILQHWSRGWVEAGGQQQRQKESKEEEGAAVGGHCVHRQHAQPTRT